MIKHWSSFFNKERREAKDKLAIDSTTFVDRWYKQEDKGYDKKRVWLGMTLWFDLSTPSSSLLLEVALGLRILLGGRPTDIFGDIA